MVRLLNECGENVISDAGIKAKGHADTILGSARSQNYTATTINDHVHASLLEVRHPKMHLKRQTTEL